MRGSDVLGALLKGSFALLEERLRDSHEEYWRERALRFANKPGFIMWHCARILDWTVNCAIQGIPEIADAAPWNERFPREAGAGFGIPLVLADRIADSISPSEVADYLIDVRAPALSWFGGQTDASLDTIPQLKANQARRPMYLEPRVWAEIEDLDGLPAWQLLMRPAGAHIRRHVGEYDLLLELLRTEGATPRA